MAESALRAQFYMSAATEPSVRQRNTFNREDTMNLWRSLGLLVVAAGGFTACGTTDGLDPAARDQASLIIFYDDSSRIIAPDTVNRGAEFAVSFQTFGGGCTRSSSRTDATVSADTVHLASFDRSSGGPNCSRDLLLLSHSVNVRLHVQGLAVIRLVGEQRGGVTGAENGPADITRRIFVR